MKKLTIALAMLGTGVMGAGSALASSTTMVDTGTYTMHNHADGGAASPFYGLRLDGLLDGDASSIYTFDFDAPGAAMTLEYDGNTIHISGTAWGGLDIGSSYDSPELWTIDMTYASGVSLAGETGGVADIRIVDESPANTGTISSSAGTFSLDGYAGNHGFVLQIGDEDGSGHRGVAGLSGWGWLNHAPVNGNSPGHLASSDWLFTLEPAAVPVPAALWLFGSALLGFGVIGRRR